MADANNLDGFIATVRDRGPRGRHGIGFAKTCLASVDGCFAGGLCPHKFFDQATPEAWSRVLKESERQLVYHNPAMRVKKYSESCPAGMCLSFDAVLTSVTRDRDRDILRTKGARVDERMALLWQHVPLFPVGKYLGTKSHDDKRILFRGGIADIDLGRDAAVLVKLDALRISHGFTPTVFEPIVERGPDGKDYETGYEVKEFDILEVSLVSVPSNPDAIITAYSGEKLHHPVVKQWAKGYYDGRPVLARGGWGGRAEPFTIPVRVEVQGVDGVKSLTQGVGTAGCACAGTGHQAMEQTGHEAEYDRGEVLDAVAVAELGKPYPNQHACRLRAPGDFQDGSFRTLKRKHDGKGYSVIMGRLKGQSTLTEQSYRYPKAAWSAADAKAHCHAHDKSATFEAAADKGGVPLLSKAKDLMAKQGLKGPIPLMMPPVAGSWEYLSCCLEATARDHLEAGKVEVKDWEDVLLLATFPDHAVLAVCGWNPVPKSVWASDWELGSDGEPAWKGEPKAVEITTQIQEASATARARKLGGFLAKDLAPDEAQWKGLKGGQTVVTVAAAGTTVKYAKIRQKDRERVKDARDLVHQVATDDKTEPAKHHKVILEKARDNLDLILQETQAEQDARGDEAGKALGVAELGRKMAAALVQTPGVADEARKALADVGAVLHCIDEQKAAAEWDVLAAGVGVT